MQPDSSSHFRSRSSRPPWLVPTILLVVLTAAALVDRPQPRPEGAALEGSLEALGSIETDPTNPVRSRARFLWNTFAGADTYELRFWSYDMREVGRYPAGSGNMAVLDLEEVWRPVAPSRVVHWRVVALVGGKEVASSELEILRLP